MVGTLLDAGDRSLRAFGVELVSLIVAALFAQARRASTVSLGTLIYEALCWAAVVSVAKVSITAVIGHIRWSGPIGPPINVLTFYVIPPLFAAAFALRRPRVAGVLGLLWVAVYLGDFRLSFYLDLTFLRGELAQDCLPIAGSLAMLFAPHRYRTGGWAWVLPTGVWALCELLLNTYVCVGKVAPMVAVLLVVPLRPGLALGTALVWTQMLSWFLPFEHGNGLLPIGLACCLPAAVVVIAVCRRAAFDRSTTDPAD